MSINERIKAIRIESGKSQEDFALSIGLKRGNYAQIELGKQKPTLETITTIVRIYNKSYGYVIEGGNDIIEDSSARSLTVIVGEKNTPKTTPNNTPNEVRILTPQIITVDREGNENILWVPVRARAGYLLGFGDREFIQTLPSFSLPGLPDGTYRAFEVDGDSMFPTIKHREMVIGQFIEKFDYIRDDRVYIIVHKTEGVLIKRVLNRIDKHGLLILKSDALDNRNLYPNISVNPEDVQEIWYAVWHGGFDFTSPSDSWRRINNHEADITVLQNTVDVLTEALRNSGILK